MTQSYKLAIVYFLAFSLLLMLSGFLLFEEKIGLSVEAVTRYYVGDEVRFISAKTFEGVLKIILPHIFAFGLLSMVLLHFLVFTKHKKTKSIQWCMYLLFVSAFCEISSPFFILLGSAHFAYIKVISFVVFEASIIYVAWLLFRSIMHK